jgi:hypothetical protein
MLIVYHNWLVVWNMTFLTFHSVGNFIIPTQLTNSIIFQRGRSTTNQIMFITETAHGEYPVDRPIWLKWLKMALAAKP